MHTKRPSIAPLNIYQFLYIIEELEGQKDYRLAVLCHLLFRLVKIRDCLETIKISDVYNTDGSLKQKLIYFEYSHREDVEPKERMVSIAGEHFLLSLEEYWPKIVHKPFNGPLFYLTKRSTPLKGHDVRYLLKQFIGKRDIQQCTMQSFRKGGARYAYENGSRIEILSNVLGHQSIRYTFVYIDIMPPREVEGMKPLTI